MNNRRWTAEENNKIIEAVKRHPENLQYCFYTLSKKLDRTPQSISKQYYTVIRPNIPAEDPIIFTGSPKRIVPNTKIVKRGKESNKLSILKAKWKRILKIITE